MELTDGRTSRPTRNKQRLLHQLRKDARASRRAGPTGRRITQLLKRTRLSLNVIE